MKECNPWLAALEEKVWLKYMLEEECTPLQVARRQREQEGRNQVQEHTLPVHVSHDLLPSTRPHLQIQGFWENILDLNNSIFARLPKRLMSIS